MYLTSIPVVEGDDYQQHKNVRQIFPGDQKVLFQKSDNSIIIMSSKKPTKEFPVKEIDLSLVSVKDMKHAFTVRLNPVKRDIKTHKRVALESDNIKSWITKKLNEAGTDVKFQYIKEGIRRSKKQDKTISFVSVLCFGFLTIKDTEAFRKALEDGIGFGKGFGFGMLNIFSC